MKTIVLLLASALAALGLSACGGGGDTESPDAVVQAFLEKLADGDGEGACDLLSDEGREGSLAPVCAGDTGPVPEEFSESVEDVSVETTEESESEATVEATVGDVPGFSFDVGKYDDEWLIDGLAIAEIDI